MFHFHVPRILIPSIATSKSPFLKILVSLEYHFTDLIFLLNFIIMYERSYYFLYILAMKHLMLTRNSPFFPKNGLTNNLFSLFQRADMIGS